MQINHWMYVAEIRRSEMTDAWQWFIRHRDGQEILAWGQKQSQEAALHSASEGLKTFDGQLRRNLASKASQAR